MGEERKLVREERGGGGERDLRSIVSYGKEGTCRCRSVPNGLTTRDNTELVVEEGRDQSKGNS